MTGAKARESRGAPQGQTLLRYSQPRHPAHGPPLVVPLPQADQSESPSCSSDSAELQSLLHKRKLKLTFHTRVDMKMNMFLLHVETFSSF